MEIYMLETYASNLCQKLVSNFCVLRIYISHILIIQNYQV